MNTKTLQAGSNDYLSQRPSLTASRWYPWVIVLMSSLFLFYKYVLQVSPSVMTNELMRVFQLNAQGLGYLAATYFLSYLIVQLFVGPLLDRYSPRTLTAVAIALCALSAFWFAGSTTLFNAECSRVLLGAGAAFATVSYLKLAAVWFSPKRFAVVGGLLATAASLGGLIGQAPLAYSVQTQGWQHTMLYCGVLGLVVAGVYYFLVRDRQVTKHAVVGEEQKLTYAVFVKFLLDVRNWLLTLYSGLAWAPMAVFGGLWGNPFLQEAYHLSRTQSSGLISAAFVGLAVGGPLFGWLASLTGRRLTVMAVGVLLSGVALVGVLFSPVHSLVFLTTVLFLFGMGTGAFMLGFAVGRDLNQLCLAASVIALVNTGDALFGFFSEPWVGHRLDALWDGRVVNGVHYFSVSNYQHAMLLLPVYLLLALGCLAVLGRLKKR